MAAAAGRSLLLLLSSRGGGGGAGGCGALTAGCFPGLAVSRHRQQQHHRTVHQRLSSWQNLGVVYCSTVVPSDDVTVVYQNGLPVISVRLPSRRERCQFTLKPISDSVGVFLRQLQEEDRGIDRVAIYSPDGVRVAASTGIDLLLLDDFKLVINDLTYHVRPPKGDLLSHENAATLNDVKTLVQQLYTTLCIEQHQLNKERELIERLENLKEQLAPLEKVRIEISRKAEKRTTLVLWGGLAYMATQFGILARLTWWEYSWDIMEPVTYFITYGSAMAMYAYFVMTRQEYVYPEARDRQYLLFFHKGAKKSRFDLEKYNQLKDAIAQPNCTLSSVAASDGSQLTRISRALTTTDTSVPPRHINPTQGFVGGLLTGELQSTCVFRCSPGASASSRVSSANFSGGSVEAETAKDRLVLDSLLSSDFQKLR
ncbi:Calcium uniporter protein, mitochondrial [Sciurus carolinensis]|uniref:Calcium uniporter protein n=1 Tax=Sciurus carolinensis TaxID=30640 RepID=A0AA41SUX8_SCICA|nr:Calcium uniporter protein, mitochondrial [Sciurus carolinensis]